MLSFVLQACTGAPTAPPLPPDLPADVVVLRVVDGELTVGVGSPGTELEFAL